MKFAMEICNTFLGLPPSNFATGSSWSDAAPGDQKWVEKVFDVAFLHNELVS